MRAHDWAARAVHEAQLHRHNAFLTLTYDEEHLPADGTLQPADLCRFWKRARKAGYQLRYLACGEYGETNGRPHYHAAVFGWKLPRDAYTLGRGGYTSPILAKLWPWGGHSIDSFNKERAAYVAKYSIKADKRNYDHDGVFRQPPFLRASRRPAIGLNWLAKYQHDLVHGYLVTNTYKTAIPRYYKRRLKDDNPELHQLITRNILANIERQHTDRHDYDRLQDEEKIHQQKALLDKRNL